MAGLDVVIPAGGTIDADFERVVGVSSKALIAYEDITVLCRTITALRAAKSIGRIVVVGTQDVLSHADAKLADAAFPATGDAIDNIKIGLDWLATQDLPPYKVLIVTGDLPFLTPESIERFLELSTGDKDLYVPIVNKRDWDEAFPASTATFVRLRDGEWTSGSVFLISIRGFKVAFPNLKEIFKRRKSKLQIAMMLGLKFLWDWKNNKLTVIDVEKKVEEHVGINALAVPGAPPELAYDIDFFDDYHYALQTFRERAAAAEQERQASKT